jgi:serine/threonine-protein kinase HipA
MISMTTTPSERFYGVWLRELRVGTLTQRGDHTRFVLAESYLDEPARPVLGLVFEQDLGARHAAALRLPCWFSNLLPEGRLREWIAAERHVSAQREMELLAQVGHDLPGAVRIRPVEMPHADDRDWSSEPVAPPTGGSADTPWRFSLAGVALKFSVLAAHDRLTLPASGVGGDWIVKLPDRVYRDVPRNEFAMMSLAAAAGIDVPRVRLVHRDDIDGLPDGVWPEHEEWAYAVRRFDRTDDHGLVHIEDLAQVRNVYPDDKYRGNYETVGALLHRGRDVESLREFARRLVFTVLIANGDAHLKNWSLIYDDPRVPRIAPAYDLVSTRHYMGAGETLGLKFGGTKRFDRIRLATFDRLEHRLGVAADLAAAGREVIERVVEHWPAFSDALGDNTGLREDIDASIAERARTLIGRG